MVLRVLEGFGFLLVVLPAPGLVRQLVPGAKLNSMIGVWGAYMPFGTATALLLGPWCIAALGWRGWWWLLGAVSLGDGRLLARRVPAAGPRAAAGAAASPGWRGCGVRWPCPGRGWWRWLSPPMPGSGCR